LPASRLAPPPPSCPPALLPRTAPLPILVEAPGDQLHRLVLNLIQNALVHTPPGTAVDARARREGDDVIIEVSDEGPGVPDEMREIGRGYGWTPAARTTRIRSSYSRPTAA